MPAMPLALGATTPCPSRLIVRSRPFGPRTSILPGLLRSAPPPRQNGRSHTPQPPQAAPVAAPAAAAPGVWNVLVQAYSVNPAGVLLGVGACLAAVALCVLLVAAIPALFALRRSAQAAEALMHAMREEIPDTAAALRLSGLEVADAVQEVTALGADLTQGVRASARAIVDADRSVREGVVMAAEAVTKGAVPAVKRALPETRDAVQAALKERSELKYSAETMTEVAGATKVAVKRLRTLLSAAGWASGTVRTVGRLRRGSNAADNNDYGRGGRVDDTNAWGR